MNVSFSSYGYKAGESFKARFLSNIRYEERKDRIVVHEGCLEHARWDAGPIEWLFVDACKSVPLIEHVLRSFFPALIPGAVLVDQDFRFAWTPYVNVICAYYLLRDYLVPVTKTDQGSSVVFRVHKEIPSDAIGLALKFQMQSARQIRQALDHFIGVGVL